MKKTSTSFDMEQGIARSRVFLSLISMLAVYVDPTEPTLTRWLPLSGGAFTLSYYWVSVLTAHLLFSLVLLFMHRTGRGRQETLARAATAGDILFAAAIALVTEGTTSPFYSFFAFAVLAAALHSGWRRAVLVTALSTGLYVILVVVSAPPHQTFFILMRAAYIAITGYLVAYLGQERLNQEERIRSLEAGVQRERIARSLHDGYAQALAGVNLRIETCRELFRRGQQEEALAELGDLQVGVNHEHDQLRAYIRSLVDMDANQDAHGPGDATRVVVRTNFRGSAAFVEHVLSIMLEGTRNVRRHARATDATIETHTVGRGLELTIDDNGAGFPAGAEPPWSVVSRVAECGGQLTLARTRPKGSQLKIHLPEA